MEYIKKNIPLVTVYCITYNHVKYIKAALDGFVMQKTNFEFEVLIHDDCSTDGTVEILKQYEKEYSFIKVVYEIENQYSQGKSFASKMYPLMRGKYIAYCEGDDYWIHPNKLQLLFDYMETHEKCAMCCHAYKNYIANSDEVIQEIHTCDKNQIVSVERCIEYDKPSQLASQMFKKEIVVDRPEIFLNRGIGDYTLLLYAATCGDIFYFDEVMATHRIASDGSWTQSVYLNRSKRIKHDKSMISFLNDFSIYTNHAYDSTIVSKIKSFEFDIISINRDYRILKKHSEYKKCSLKRKILINLGCIFPSLIKKIEDKREGIL